MSPGTALLILLVCMAGSAFFSGIETGIISIHRMRLQHLVRKGSYGARVLEHFLQNPDQLLGTTLVGTNICNVTISVVAASAAVALIGRWGETVSTAVMTVVVLIWCEFLPKAWFHARPLERCRRFSRVLRVSELVLRPLAVSVTWLAKWIVPGAAPALSRSGPSVSKEVLKVLARDGERNGVLSRSEREMIHRVIELSTKTAREIMVPRSRITMVRADTPVSRFYDIARDSGYTRMPVYDGGRDKFTGVVNVFYVLSLQPGDMDKPVSEFARPPLIIPEDMPVDEIFPRLRRFRQPMCLVAAGGKDPDVIGLMTTEDVLEQIVGEL
ncbi:MAG: hemolysin family protein [Kiritimatiellia bacterium]